jgi:hypothetical protein
LADFVNDGGGIPKPPKPSPVIAQEIDDFLQYRRGTASDDVVARVKRSCLEGNLPSIISRATSAGRAGSIPDLSGICDSRSNETERQRLESFYPELCSLLVIDTPIDEIVQQLGLSRARIESFIRENGGCPFFKGEIAAKAAFFRRNFLDGERKE